MKNRPLGSFAASALYERIKQLSDEHGSMRAAATALGIDAGYLSRLASGEKNEPSDDVLSRLGLCRSVSYSSLAAPSHPPATEGDDRDAARYRFLRHADLDDMAAKYWPNGADVPEDAEFDAAVDAAMGASPPATPASTVQAEAVVSDAEIMRIYKDARYVFDCDGKETAQEVRDVVEWYHASLLALRSGTHPDDLAVDRFAVAMKAKMAKQRAKGYGGWNDANICTVESLSQMLIEHVPKGDTVDVANFAMMLHQRGSAIVQPVAAESGQSVVLPRHWFGELLALCGPEQHELRERVSNSVRPATAGWKLVPAEPTDEMLNAAHEVAYVLRHNEWRYTEAKRYAAMLAAAPCNSPATCPHADEPRGCFRVRCQLGNKCVGEPE